MKLASLLSRLALFAYLAIANSAWAQVTDLDLEEQAIREAVASVAPSVVRIETLGGREKVGELLVGEGPTTGVILTADGYIVSSSFNFLHDPASILVTTPGGKRVAAKIIGRDKARMLVLLKIETPEDLMPVAVVPRSELSVGQYAIAVGRTLHEKEPNMSVGVVSALQRVWGRAIQTDAKISPSNYGGALVDLHGRAMGILTPLMPQSEGEVAGVQWYDSGIGFAAPLDDWLPRLGALKAGKTLSPGVIGIALKPGDIYALPAEIAVCQINAPAYRAGLRAGDTLVEADGTKIERQVQLRHVLGRHYAGDSMKLVALRGESRVEATIELVDHLDAYEYPSLGILPMRDGSQPGVIVRYVFKNSPAEKVELTRGDRIVTAMEKPIATAEELRNAVAAHDRQQPFTVEYFRGETKHTAEIKLAALTMAVPEDLPLGTADSVAPAASADGAAAEAVKIDRGLIEIKLPEEKQECFAYVPTTYDPAEATGLLVWFAPPGQFDKAQVEKSWRDTAEKHHLIVLAPRPAEAGRWHPGEIAVVRKFIENVVSRYNIDRSRIALHGRGVGGTMAWFTALANRNLIRGVAPIDSPLPVRAELENDPVQRLFVYSIATKGNPAAAAMKSAEERLKKAKIPLLQTTLESDRDLNAEEFAKLARWLDVLDRI